MPKGKRTRTLRRDRQANQRKSPMETEADALGDSEVPNVVGAEDPVEETNNEVEDAADVVETAEAADVIETTDAADGIETAEREGAQGSDVNETPRRRIRKRRSRSNRGEPSSTPDNDRKEKRGDIKVAGVVFMCNAQTKKDCFKYGVFGFPEQKKDIVDQVKKGMKLFLYDIDKKHLHGIYEASSRGGSDLVPEAFKESGRKFPAQVKFRIHKDCQPLEESVFKQAVQDNNNRGGRFRCDLTSEQVGKLMRLFRPLDSEGLPQPRRDRDAQREPTSRNERKGPSRDRRASGDRHARGYARHVSRPSPPVPVREPVYSRELYARERPLVDLDYYRTQPSYLPASQIAVAETAAARRRYLDNLYLEQTSLIAQRPLLHDPLYRGVEYQREMPYSSIVAPRNADPLYRGAEYQREIPYSIVPPRNADPLYRGAEYQREMPYSSYGGIRTSGFPN